MVMGVDGTRDQSSPSAASISLSMYLSRYGTVQYNSVHGEVEPSCSHVHCMISVTKPKRLVQ